MSKKKTRETFQLVATRPDGEQLRAGQATVVEGLVAQVRSRGIGEPSSRKEGAKGN